MGVAVMGAVGAASAGPEASAGRVPALGRIVVVAFENHSYDDIIGQPSAPTFNRLAHRYAILTRYLAAAHPSLPNYLALASGSTQGVTTNCTDCLFDARNLADIIEASGRTWKAYSEGLPEPGFTGAQSGLYVKRHNPFPYFKSVLERPSRLRRIVPFDNFARDLARGRLPDLSFVIPDLCNSMHDCSVARGDAWLDRFLKPVLASPQLKRGMVAVTFDEASHDAGPEGGHVSTLILGPRVRPGSRSGMAYTHYSLLRTIEDAWHLPYLGSSAEATPITGIWRARVS